MQVWLWVFQPMLRGTVLFRERKDFINVNNWVMDHLGIIDEFWAISWLRTYVQ